MHITGFICTVVPPACERTLQLYSFPIFLSLTGVSLQYACSSQKKDGWPVTVDGLNSPQAFVVAGFYSYPVEKVGPVL